MLNGTQIAAAGRSGRLFSRLGLLALAASVVIATTAGTMAWKNPTRGGATTVRIGVDHFPPYAILKPDGSFEGIAVDVLNEAARRAGVSVKWVPASALGADRALATKYVDIWPILADSPERRREIHITKPWIQNDYCILTRKESRIPFASSLAVSNLTGRTVAYPSYRLTTSIAQRFLALADLQPRKTDEQVIQAVCKGDVDAGFMEARLLDPALMKRPPGCEYTSFSIRLVEGATSQAGIASTREAARTAEALRRQVTGMITDGSLPLIIDKWASFSASETRSLLALQRVEKRERLTLLSLLCSLGLVAMILWQFSFAHKMRREAERARLLETDRNTILEKLATTESLDSLLGEVSEIVERQCPEMVCTVAVREENLLVLSGPSRLPEKLARLLAHVEIGPSGVTCGVAAWSQQLVVSVDLWSDSGWASRRLALRSAGLRSCWAMPVRSVSGEIVAVISAYLKMSSRPDRERLRLLENASRLAAVVLERRRLDERLEYMATHDSLTGLPNRVFLTNRLKQMIRKARIEQQQFAVLCVDLDRFKQINDTLGHSTGDLFLKKIGELMRGVLRREDILARIGGDEFTVLLPGVDSQQKAEETAHRLLCAICTPIRVNEVELVGSASIGVSMYPQHATTVEELQRHADRAMYAAKAAGKCGYSVAAPESSAPESSVVESSVVESPAVLA